MNEMAALEPEYYTDKTPVTRSLFKNKGLKNKINPKRRRKF